MYNAKRALILYMVISTAQFSICTPSVFPFILTLSQKLIPTHAINNHKNLIIAGIVAAILVAVPRACWKNNPKKTLIRKRIERQLKLENSNFINTIFNTIFKTSFWEILWKTRNINLKNIFHGNDKKTQKKLLGEMVTALTSNNSTTLEVLIEKPFWNDQLFDPNITLPYSSNGETITEQIQNGYRDDKTDPLKPQSWITPLQYVIVSDFTTENKLNLINILLTNGASPFGQDQKGDDALHYAVKYATALGNPDIEVIERLIEAGAKADIPNSHYETCMHLLSTIENSDTRQEVANVLIQCKPDMDVIDKFGNTPLLNAVKHGRLDLVKLFLNKTQARIDQIDSNGNSILMLAMLKAAEEKENGGDDSLYMGIINYLLERSDITKIIDLSNKQGWKPIHFAINYKDCRLINSLVNQFQVNITLETEIIDQDNCWEESPIQQAFRLGDEKTLSIFLEYNTIPTDFRTSDSDTIAHLIAQLDNDHTASRLMTKLAKNGFLLNKKNNTQQRPVEIACSRSNIAVAKVLIKQSKDIIPRNTFCGDGNSLAHLIVELNNERAEQLMPMLKANNFQLNKRNLNGETIFHIAVKNKRKNLIGWIKSNVPSIHTTPNADGQIPLHYAAKQGNRELYKLIIHSKKEGQIADHDGRTPLNLLEENQSRWYKARNTISAKLSPIFGDRLLPNFLTNRENFETEEPSNNLLLNQVLLHNLPHC